MVFVCRPCCCLIWGRTRGSRNELSRVFATVAGLDRNAFSAEKN